MGTSHKHSIIVDCDIAASARIYDHVNLFRCKIGNNSKVDSFVYIEEQVVIGDDCKIRPHTFIPTGVKIGNRVFIGPNVTFTNDKYPSIGEDWELLETIVGNDVAIGAGSTILPGITIGDNVSIGAGSVVTKDIPANYIAYGNPAKLIREK